MVSEPDVELWRTVLRAWFGTDASCEREREEGERLVAEAEAKVDTLQRVLDERPARNLDEAMYDLTRRQRRG